MVYRAGGGSGAATAPLTGTGATVTTSTPLIDTSQTWNAGAVTFTGWKLNITNTASAAASLLMDLQADGTSQLVVRKDGRVTFGTAGSGTGFIISPAISTWTSFLRGDAGDYAAIGFNRAAMTTDLNIGSAGLIQWTNSGANPLAGGTADTFFKRRAAANLQLGAADAAAPVAQTLSVQSVVTGTSNTAGPNFTIDAAQSTGSAVGGSIIFRTSPAGSSGTAVNALANALTLSDRLMVQRGQGQNWHYITSDTNQLSIQPNGANIGLVIQNDGLMVGSANAYYSMATTCSGGADVFIRRDAANTLALRNGTSAQQFNIYKTYTDASNYSRLSIGAAADAATNYIYGENAGTGAAKDLLVGMSGSKDILIYTAAGPRWVIKSTGHLWAGSPDGLTGDNTYDIGASGASRPRTAYIGTDVFFGRNLVPTATFATNQTTGFINIPGAAGVPSGVPSNTTGFPMYYDSTNNKIYVYNGSWRSTAALT